jgi:hypothetical protein
MAQINLPLKRGTKRDVLKRPKAKGTRLKEQDFSNQ